MNLRPLEMVLVWYLALNAALAGVGMLRRSTPGFGVNPCDRPLARLEYVVPGFQVGCWFASVP